MNRQSDARIAKKRGAATSRAVASQSVGGSAAFWATKRCVDICVGVVLLPVVAGVALLLLILNPFFNAGPVFFVQPRMGRDCKPFAAYKFRSMTAPTGTKRGHDAPLEVDRITPLGALLRRTRLDEIPQAINILRGEMSLIGPRPDFFSHARIYLRTIPEYRDRHHVRPGITGLAQVTQGYAEGVEATREKTRLDIEYIESAGFRLDFKLLWMTALTILRGQGR